MRFYWIGLFIVMASTGLYQDHKEHKEMVSKIRSPADILIEVHNKREQRKLFEESMEKIRSKGIRITEDYDRDRTPQITYHLDHYPMPYDKDDIIEYASKL